MKTFNSITVALMAVSLLTFSACEKEEEPQPDPEACFTIEDASVVAEDTVRFFTCSVEADKYLWDFGDSTTTVNEKEPTHVYAKSGNYTVTLTVTNSSTSSTTTETVEVAQKTPLKVTMTKLVVLKWPALNDLGVPWDSDGGPDIWYKMYLNGSEKISALEFKTDCVVGTPQVFELDFPYATTNVAASIAFEFYDFEAAGLNHLMGGANLTFSPISMHDDGTSVITVSNSDWEYEVHVSWEY